MVRINISKLESEEGTLNNHLKAAKDLYKNAKLEQFTIKLAMSKLMVELADLQSIIVEQERINVQIET